VAGLAPIRRTWSGLLPVPGNSGEFEWDGYIPLDELPHLYNPPTHFIATANNKVIPEDYKYDIGFEWASPYRVRRIEEVLFSKSDWTVSDFERLQLDELSLPARELVPLLSEVKVDDRDVKDFIELLINWDKKLSKDSAAAALFEVWVTKLIQNVFKPLVTDDAWRLINKQIPVPVLINYLKEKKGQSLVLNRSSKNRILIKSLIEAAQYLSAQVGNDFKEWNWGKLHIAQFRHFLSHDEATRSLFDLKSVSCGGDIDTVNGTSGENFRVTIGASYRQIIDFNDWDNSFAVNAPGQSGQPGSQHYGDLLSMWAEGKYFPLLFGREAVEKNAKQRLILVPK